MQTRRNTSQVSMEVSAPASGQPERISCRGLFHKESRDSSHVINHITSQYGLCGGLIKLTCGLLNHATKKITASVPALASCTQRQQHEWIHTEEIPACS